MTSLSASLSRFITDPETGKVRRGALASIQRYFAGDVAKSTIAKWSRGEWKPSPVRSAQLRAMIRAKIDLSPRKASGRPKNSGLTT